MEHFNIQDLLRARADQRSFHVASEQQIRVEFRNMMAGDMLEPGTMVLSFSHASRAHSLLTLTVPR